MKNLVIITGHSKGIGAGILETFKRDEKWITLGISRTEGDKKPDYCILHDLLDIHQLLPILKYKIKEISKQLNVSAISFVHNFGQTHSSNILETDLETWQRIIKANMEIPFLSVKEISPLMPHGSSHLFIGSTLSTIAVANSSAYISSKHGLAGLMKSVAIDLKNLGIRSNLICPGFTETDMANFVLEEAANQNNISLEEMTTKIIEQSPLKRMLKPQEIGEFVYYLAQTPSINGEILHINGGFGL